jgi:hypothetical protein
MYRGAFNEKHSTTETNCLFAPTTTATTQKHSQSRCEAKCRADKKKKKFISTQNKENRNERERDTERENVVGETNWFGVHQVHAQESLHSDWKTVAPRRWRYLPSSLITLLQAASCPWPSIFHSLRARDSDWDSDEEKSPPAQLWIRPCRYEKRKFFLCECRRVLEASEDVLRLLLSFQNLERSFLLEEEAWWLVVRGP